MLSIEISDMKIYLADCKTTKNKVTVTAFDSISTPEGSVKNGIITNMSELSSALQDCIWKNHFKSKSARITVRSSAVVAREVTVPSVKQKEMLPLLRGEIEQMSNAKQDYVMDYAILERFTKDDVPMCRVLCVVMPRQMVQGYLDLIEKHLSLKQAGLDVFTHVLARLAEYSPGICQDGAVVIASVSENEVDLCLIEEKDRFFMRTAPINVVKDVVESEYILSSIGVGNMISDSMKKDQIAAAAAENISKLVNFQSQKNKQNPVSRIYLCGDLSQDAEFCSKVQESTRVPLQTLDVPDFVDCAQEICFSQYVGSLMAAMMC